MFSSTSAGVEDCMFKSFSFFKPSLHFKVVVRNQFLNFTSEREKRIQKRNLFFDAYFALWKNGKREKMSGQTYDNQISENRGYAARQDHLGPNITANPVSDIHLAVK
jgi:hypothetical protein